MIEYALRSGLLVELLRLGVSCEANILSAALLNVHLQPTSRIGPIPPSDTLDWWWRRVSVSFLCHPRTVGVVQGS